MITYAIEDWAAAQPEFAELCVQHYEEIAHNKESIKLEPNWPMYAALAEQKILQLFTARADGKLVGYQIYFVMPHIHYKSSLTAISDVLFLALECRQGTAGIKLMKFAEQELQRIGVQRVIQNVKVNNDWSAILERMGYTFFERIYAKMLRY